MSDCYRDDGTGTEDWCVTSITDQITAWDPIPAMGAPNRAMLYYRLRTTAEALRAFVDSRRESGWVIAAGKNAEPALNKALPDARAVLARLEQEGLT